MATQRNDYYTYAYLREDKTPYYIGKGKGGRVYTRHKRIKPPKDKSLIIFLKKNLTEEEAFKHEIYMIAIFGRKDLGTGILRNLSNGGEGSSGAVHSEEWKKAHSERMSGVPKTEEHRKNMSVARSGEKNHNYGKCGAAHNSSKAIIAIEPDGTELHFVSGSEAVRELGINGGKLSGHLNTNWSPIRGKFKGWRFIFAATLNTNN